MQAICPLTGRTTRTAPTRYSRDGYRLVRCLETDFVYLENPPAYEEVRDDFPWEQTTVAERDRRRRTEPIMSRLSDAAKRAKHLIAPRRNHTYKLAAKTVAAFDTNRPLTLLDVGCGAGRLAIDCCERLAATGRQVTPIGLELSPQLAQIATELFAEWDGIVIADSALDGLAKVDDGSVHLATLISFLEHDPNPLPLLRALRPKLAEDGVAIVKVPNFASLNRRVRGERWCGFYFPDHVNYFTPRTLRILAKEAGYQVDPGSWADRPMLSDNMYAVLRPTSGA